MYPFIRFGEQVAIPTYGLVYLTAFLTGIGLMSWLATRVGVPFWKMVDYSFQFTIAGEIGARIVFVIVEREAFLRGDISFYQFLVAGRVVLGGIVGGVLYAIWLCRRLRLPVLAILDACLAAVPVAMGIGRFACFLSGCCYGKPTDLAWGVTFRDPAAQAISGTPIGVPLHPTQLLQGIEGILLGLLLMLLFHRRRWDGQIVSLFLMLSGVTRFGWELLRGDPRGFYLGLATSQWIGIGMIVAGGALFVWSRSRGTLETYTPPAEATARPHRKARPRRRRRRSRA